MCSIYFALHFMCVCQCLHKHLILSLECNFCVADETQYLHSPMRSPNPLVRCLIGLLACGECSVSWLACKTSEVGNVHRTRAQTVAHSHELKGFSLRVLLICIIYTPCCTCARKYIFMYQRRDEALSVSGKLDVC